MIISRLLHNGRSLVRFNRVSLGAEAAAISVRIKRMYSFNPVSVTLGAIGLH